MPKVSVLLPVRNSQDHVFTAIKSILEQTYRDFELIILDDASTDQSWDIIKKACDSRIRRYRNIFQLGVAKTLNIGLKLSQGDYVARMDADDFAYPNRLEQQVRFLEANPNVVLVGTRANLIDRQGKVVGKKKYPLKWKDLKKVMVRFNPFIHPTVVFRKSIIKKFGNYNENLNGAEDYDLFARIASRNEVVNLPEYLLDFRQMSTSVSYSQMKHVEWQSLKVKLRCILNYGYPIWQSIYLIKPTLSFLVPAVIKTKILLKT